MFMEMVIISVIIMIRMTAMVIVLMVWSLLGMAMRMRQIWNDADRNTYWFVSFWFYHGWFLWYIMVSTPW